MKKDTHQHTKPIAPPPGLTPPYGGLLVQRYYMGAEGQALLQRIKTMPRLDISENEYLDLELLGNGGFSPLEGFMDHKTYISVLENGCLLTGLPWVWPVTLAVNDDEYELISNCEEVGLYYKSMPVGVIELNGIYLWEPEKELAFLSGAQRTNLSSIIERRNKSKSRILGGNIRLVVEEAESNWSDEHLWPGAMRNYFEQQFWSHISAVFGFKAWHQGHTHMLNNVLELSDAVLMQSPSYSISDNDVFPDHVTHAAQRILFRKSFPERRVVNNHITRHIDCASERAALQHAIIAQNYGCDCLFLVRGYDGLDEDGILKIFSAARANGLKMQVEFVHPAIYCRGCGSITSIKSCPHDTEMHLTLDDKGLLDSLAKDKYPPAEILPTEIAEIFKIYSHRPKVSLSVKEERNIYLHKPEVSRQTRDALSGHRSAVLWMTGLSGSGKSTIAYRLEKQLLFSGHQVCVLDGDSLRTGLCSDLGFSSEARQENLRRVSEVAKLLCNTGILVIVSFISPFRSERNILLDILGDDLFEVYVEASLETCEMRDPKGLYRRARAGEIEEFTGITSLYEPPENPNIHIKTDDMTIEECVNSLISSMASAGFLRATHKHVPLSVQGQTMTRRNTRV